MPAPGAGGLPVRRTYTRWILKQVPAGLAITDADTPPPPVAVLNGSPPKKKLASMQEHRRPVLEDFEAVVSPIPSETDLLEDEVLVRNTCLSVDAYVTAFGMEERNVGQTVSAGSAGIVIASKSDNFMQGDTVRVSSIIPTPDAPKWLSNVVYYDASSMICLNSIISWQCCTDTPQK